MNALEKLQMVRPDRAAQLLGLSTRSLRRLVVSRELARPIRIGKSAVAFHLSDLRRYQQSRDRVW